MRWEEFKTNIDTLPKYITYVKKNIKILAPIQGQYKNEILDAIGSINIKTYNKEFERIKTNYKKLIYRDAAKKCATRTGNTRGGRKKKRRKKERRKTKKIQKGGFGFGEVPLFICLGSIALCFIGSCIVECGCCKPCGIVPSGDRIWSEIALREFANKESKKKFYNKKFACDVKTTINKTLDKKKKKSRGKSRIRVSGLGDNIVVEGDGEDTAIALQMATDAQYYNDGDWSGDTHAAYLQEMTDKYPNMDRRNPNGVEVLTEDEYQENQRQNEKERERSYREDDGPAPGGPFSSLRRRN
tara:strand:- start:246 stop:1142 length:897 start_codon:yes stop_codon:yes gene_type:complete